MRMLRFLSTTVAILCITSCERQNICLSNEAPHVNNFNCSQIEKGLSCQDCFSEKNHLPIATANYFYCLHGKVHLPTKKAK